MGIPRCTNFGDQAWTSAFDLYIGSFMTLATLASVIAIMYKTSLGSYSFYIPSTRPVNKNCILLWHRKLPRYIFPLHLQKKYGWPARLGTSSPLNVYHILWGNGFGNGWTGKMSQSHPSHRRRNGGASPPHCLYPSSTTASYSKCQQGISTATHRCIIREWRLDGSGWCQGADNLKS